MTTERFRIVGGEECRSLGTITDRCFELPVSSRLAYRIFQRSKRQSPADFPDFSRELCLELFAGLCQQHSADSTRRSLITNHVRRQGSINAWAGLFPRNDFSLMWITSRLTTIRDRKCTRPPVRSIKAIETAPQHRLAFDPTGTFLCRHFVLQFCEAGTDLPG